MRVLFLGTPEFSVPPLRAIREAGHEVALVVTRPDAAQGRGRQPAEPAVKSAARSMGLTVYQPRSVNRTEAAERLRAASADVGVVVAYGQILKPRVLLTARGGFLNLHASLLPKYRGAAPINWANIHGERETGVTVQRVTPDLDAGPVLAQRRVAVGADETAGELHDRLCEAGSALLVEVLGVMARGENVPALAQDASAVSWAPKLTKEDGRLDWRLGADEIRNRVRGLTPWPGATCCFVGGKRAVDVTLLRAAVGPAAGPDAPPGAVVGIGPREEIIVRAGRGSVIIEKLKPASGRAMDAADFVHGHRVRPGDRFE